jgi:hypothetical protein
MNITTVSFGAGDTIAISEESLYQYDYGQILQIEGLDLPTVYTVDFCNSGDSDTMPMIGDANGVTIPDDFLRTGKNINAFIWLHTGDADGETEYKIVIPVAPRPERGDEEPTPTQQTVIDQLITQLNNGVDHVDEIAESLEASPFAPGTGRESVVQINEDNPNTASGLGAIALGANSVASGRCAVAGGTFSGENHPEASSPCALAFGLGTVAAGQCSQAFGQMTRAEGLGSTALGNHTVATGRASLVAGQWNIPDENPVDTTHGAGARKYLVMVGNGTAEDAESNAATLDWGGNAVLSGKLTVGADPTGAMDVVTKQYVDQHGSGSLSVDSALSAASENPVQNKVIKSALDGKADLSDIVPVDDALLPGSENPVQNKVICKLYTTLGAEISAVDRLFVAECIYPQQDGSTDFDDVKSAFSRGKYLVCLDSHSGIMYPLLTHQEADAENDIAESFTFGAVSGNEFISFTCSDVADASEWPPPEVWTHTSVLLPEPAAALPLKDGTAAVGSSAQYARADHRHPTDTSRAAASDLAAKADKITEVTVSTAGAVSQALDAGKIYHFTGAVTALTITLNAPASGGLAQYHFDFLSGSTAPTLTMPNTVTMPDSFSVEANKRYEVDVLNNYGAVVSWANS